MMRRPLIPVFLTLCLLLPVVGCSSADTAGGGGLATVGGGGEEGDNTNGVVNPGDPVPCLERRLGGR